MYLDNYLNWKETRIISKQNIKVAYRIRTHGVSAWTRKHHVEIVVCTGIVWIMFGYDANSVFTSNQLLLSRWVFVVTISFLKENNYPFIHVCLLLTSVLLILKYFCFTCKITAYLYVVKNLLTSWEISQALFT